MGVTPTGQLICKTNAEADRVRAALETPVALTRAEPEGLTFKGVPTQDPLIWQVDETIVDAAAFKAHQARARMSDKAIRTAGIERRYTVAGLT